MAEAARLDILSVERKKGITGTVWDSDLCYEIAPFSTRTLNELLKCVLCFMTYPTSSGNDYVDLHCVLDFINIFVTKRNAEEKRTKMPLVTSECLYSFSRNVVHSSGLVINIGFRCWATVTELDSERERHLYKFLDWGGPDDFSFRGVPYNSLLHILGVKK